MIPEHFVKLQDYGFKCSNYYTGEGGRRIGITTAHLQALGFVDDSMYVHPALIEDLKNVEADLLEQGYGIVIKDAFRPVALIKLIVSLRKAQQLPVASLFNTETMPHSTGLAIDAVLTDQKTGTEMRMRNGAHGVEACKVNFYRHSIKPDEMEMHRLQRILVDTCCGRGFTLGAKMEYWHFDHSSLNDLSTRYWEQAAEW